MKRYYPDLVSSYSKNLGDNLVSIIASDMIIVVVKTLDIKVLDSIGNDTIILASKLKHAPLFITAKELDTAKDVFPLEFLDMKTDYELLSGRDLLKDMKLDKKHIRHQLEYELRSKLFKLRQAYVETADIRLGMQRLLEVSLPALSPIAKGLVYLKERSEADIPKKQKDLFACVSSHYRVSFSFADEIVASQERKKRLSKEDMKRIIKDMMRFLEHLIHSIEGIDS